VTRHIHRSHALSRERASDARFDLRNFNAPIDTGATACTRIEQRTLSQIRGRAG